MRSPTWISPALGGSVASQFREDVKVGESNSDSLNGKKRYAQFAFTHEEIERFRRDPEFHLNFRKKIEAEFNIMADMFIFGSPVQKQVQMEMIQEMETRLGPGNKELKSKLIPSWPPGCRRVTPGDGYLETLVAGHVEPVFGEISRFTEDSLLMTDGTTHKLDILVSSSDIQWRTQTFVDDC